MPKTTAPTSVYDPQTVRGRRFEMAGIHEMIRTFSEVSRLSRDFEYMARTEEDAVDICGKGSELAAIKTRFVEGRALSTAASIRALLDELEREVGR